MAPGHDDWDSSGMLDDYHIEEKGNKGIWALIILLSVIAAVAGYGFLVGF